MPEFRIKQGSIHEQFLASTAKIQIFGGGFANGKTATACVKGMQLALDYPGSNGLIARATYPKLEDTILREFMKWCPKSWIESFPKKPPPTLLMKNGSTVNFRYVQQQGASKGPSTTSNLLSATYDWIIVDQIDDPEFEYKDLTDLLGRLRGTTPYKGNNPRMPKSGPRLVILTANPTRNWLYRKFVRHLLVYKKRNIIDPELQTMLDKYGAESIDQFIQLFEGSTLENEHNLEDDYVRTLKATYTGAMADRYIGGNWAAFQGLVYPTYNDEVNAVNEQQILDWRMRNKTARFFEGFDYGLRIPTCYILFLEDTDHNVVAVDGFHEVLSSPEEGVKKIHEIRKRWGIPFDTNKAIYADPSVFRRTGGEYRTVGKSIAEIYRDEGRGVMMQRGNNDIKSGIVKVSAYITGHRSHTNPFTGLKPGPFLYFNRDRMPWVEEEITDYYFKEADDPDSEEEEPMDRNDHAMDTIKYGLTSMPDLGKLIPKAPVVYPFMTQWTERPENSIAREYRDARHG